MEKADYSRTSRLLAALGMALVLILLVLGTLSAISSPVQARYAAPVVPDPAHDHTPPARPLIQSPKLSVVKTAKTAEDPNGARVSVGGTIVYTITVQNISGSDLTNIDVTDNFPIDSLINPECVTTDHNCTPIVVTRTIVIDEPGKPEQTFVISTTEAISWTLDLPAGQAASVSFKATVACRPEGHLFTNAAIVRHGLEVQTDLLDTQIEASPTGVGGPTLSQGPTFCSEIIDTGGFYDMDWGDYDADGDLDLLLVSDLDLGVLVYRNDGNQFTRLLVFDEDILNSARWGDFNDDGRLDVLVTGFWSSSEGPNTAPDGNDYTWIGYNYILINQGGDIFTLVENDTYTKFSGVERGYTFQSNDGAFRSAVADYDDDGLVDVALGNYYALGGCGIQLNKNRGQPSALQFDFFRPQLTTWGDLDGPNADVKCLEVDARVQGLAWGDYNNDGLLDLAAAINSSPNRVLVFEQDDPNVFRYTDVVTLTNTGTQTAPFDVAWGDYDNDGYLDLAVASDQEIQIYRNNSGSFPQNAVPNQKIVLPNTQHSYALDWLDFDGDGTLELAVALNEEVEVCFFGSCFTFPHQSDSPSIVRIYDDLNTNPNSTQEISLGKGFVYRIRGIDADNDGDHDIAFTNFGERAFLFTTNAPMLAPQLTLPPNPLPQGTGVAWGDADGGLDEYNDLLFASADNGYYIHFNNGSGQFTNLPLRFFVPANDVAFGDLNHDGRLDIAAATSSNITNRIHRYGPTGYLVSPSWNSIDQSDSRDLVFGDFDQDNNGFLELIMANNGAPDTLYLNAGLQTAQSGSLPLSADSSNSRSIAWGYYDSDFQPDIAVGIYGGANRVYSNTGSNTFSLADWTPSITNDNTRSVAWGDYDGDGDLDLAVGNYGQPNYIYQNQNGSLTTSPVWSSTNESFNTTSVAWGDWDNDGDLDLAVGNDGVHLDQVYANSTVPGSGPRFTWRWQSASPNNTQAIAWGDVDGDGDLELAAAGDSNGYYKNTYVSPGHLGVRNMPLPLNASYPSIARPVPQQGTIWSRPLLTAATSLVIPINFSVYDPDGPRQNGSRNNLLNVKGQYGVLDQFKFEYSLRDGGGWKTATSDTPIDFDSGTRNYTFDWIAGQDLINPNDAVGDNVRFRVSIVHSNKNGLVQRTKTSAVSPPFRVRNLSCVWPEDPKIKVDPSANVSAGQIVTFTASAIGGAPGPTGQIFYDWDFGDNMTGTSVIVPHIYTRGQTYTVSLTVRGVACPVTRPVYTTTTVVVVGGGGTGDIYLPVILKSGSSASSTPSTTDDSLPLTEEIHEDETVIVPSAYYELSKNLGLPQITSLFGDIQANRTVLQWEPLSPDIPISGYRLYRAPMGETNFQLLADVPANIISYPDDTATCGQMYFVTAYDSAGESLPSISTYFSPPCQ